MQELCGHQIELTVGETHLEIVVLEVDVTQQLPASAAARSRATSGNVGGDHRPSPRCQPDGVGALAAPQVEGAPGCQRFGHLGQPEVHPPAPDPITLAVVLVPMLLHIGGRPRQDGQPDVIGQQALHHRSRRE